MIFKFQISKHNFCLNLLKESETGLYVCLNTFLGYGQDYVDHHVKKTGKTIFLHLKKLKKLIPQDINELEPEKKITRLAIGIEGGFPIENTPKYEYEETNSIAIFPGPTKIPLPNLNLPIEVYSSCRVMISKLIINHYTSWQIVFKEFLLPQVPVTWKNYQHLN